MASEIDSYHAQLVELSHEIEAMIVKLPKTRKAERNGVRNEALG